MLVIRHRAVQAIAKTKENCQNPSLKTGFSQLWTFYFC